jgi:hypothetical protein
MRLQAATTVLTIERIKGRVERVAPIALRRLAPRTTTVGWMAARVVVFCLIQRRIVRFLLHAGTSFFKAKWMLIRVDNLVIPLVTNDIRWYNSSGLVSIHDDSPFD